MPVSTEAEPVLEARGVSKRFPGVLALDEVSCSLLPGEVHALVGENGAGKSTLIKVLTGVYRPDGGELRYRGEPVAFATPLEAQRSGISTIYQEINLVPMMSVARNLLLGREPRNRLGVIDTAAMHAEAERVLVGYGVQTDVRRPLRTLGVGAQQMVALARAVSVDARVIIMDEPTSSLEPREVEKLIGVVGELRRSGIAVVYVSHRLEELYRVCDRVTVLRDGRLVHTGPLAGLCRLRLISLMLGRDLADAPPARSSGASGAGRSGRGRDTGTIPVVEARNLTRRHLLHDVSVTVRPGEVVGLGGLLGAGRSETAKAMIGALPLDEGVVVVAGVPLRHRSTNSAIRAGISLLPEDRKAEGIVPTLSVRENIALAALPRLSRAGIVSDERIDRVVDTFMRRLRIKAASPYQRVSELSGGNQQKVLLARWLAVQPKALLLDEPTRGIDVGAKAEVRALIDELAEEGLGVLLISSDLQELVDGSDRVVVLREGAVVQELRGDEVTEEAIMSSIAAHSQGGGFRDTDSRGADSRSADLRGADSRGADSRVADTRGTDFPGTDLGGADARDTNPGSADLRGMDSRGADSRIADARGADAQGIDSLGADLGGADARDTSSGGADSGGADAGGAEVRGADPQTEAEVEAEAGSGSLLGPGGGDSSV